jgi:hypothetical protein
MRMGLEIADALRRMYPSGFHLEKTIELLGSQSTIEQLERGEVPARIVTSWSGDLRKFRRICQKCLLNY